MSTDFSGGLAALSVLSGANSFATYGMTVPSESRAVRLAKVQFTAPPTVAPWKLPATTTPVSQQVSAVAALTTIVDPTPPATTAAGKDIQTSFTTYKALDRLRLLATAASATTASATERAQLNVAFTRGLNDLQTFLSQAPTDKVALAFATSTRRNDSVAVAAPKTLSAVGAPVAASRTDALPGLTGNEVFRVDLSRPNRSDSITVDLSTGPQPPTLTSVSDAINAAISAIPQLDANGAVVLDAKGAVVPKWTAKFTPTKTGEQWGLNLAVTNDQERVRVVDTEATAAVFVASGLTAPNAVATTQLFRFDNAASTLAKTTLGSIAASDSVASASAALTAAKPTIPGVTLASTQVAGKTTAQAVASDAAGNTFVVGTVAGDIASNKGTAAGDMFLTKVDSKGGVVWQRSLGASGGASGAAISLATNGDLVVASTINGNFDGNGTDGDIAVSRFSAQGDEKFTTLIRSPGADTASSVAVAGDGAIFVGGQTATGGGDGFVARLDPTGRLAERRTIASGGTGTETGTVNGLAIGSDGNVLALVKTGSVSSVQELSARSLATNLGTLSLGNVDARSIAVAADGSIAVAGSEAAAGIRNGFVTRLDRGLTGAATTSLATSGSTEVDSVAFLGNDIIAGGRTAGALGGTQIGTVDGFVARIDGTSGTITTLRQFGSSQSTAAPVQVAVEAGGTSKVGALGLVEGILNPDQSGTLVAQTSLRGGDEFSLKLGNGPTAKIVIDASDTVATLVARIAQQTGSKTAVTDGYTSSGDVLRFQATETTPIVLTAGAAGKDALAKLGIKPTRLTAPPLPTATGPKVTPGGTFSLNLRDGLNLTTAKDAGIALSSITSAILMTQSAYRSLYWDAGKAALVNGYAGGTTQLTPQQSAQLAGYQTALARLTSAASSTTSTGF